jgi:Holliday junction resolvase RusA-like endonuclease
VEILSFTIPLVPKPQKRPRAVRNKAGARMHKDPAQAGYEFSLVAALLPFRPPQPMEGGVSLTFEAAFPFPKTVPKSRRPAARHLKKPDVDNLAKFLMDCLQDAQFFWDDKQVTRLEGKKVLSDGPGYWKITLATDREGD